MSRTVITTLLTLTCVCTISARATAQDVVDSPSLGKGATALGSSSSLSTRTAVEPSSECWSLNCGGLAPTRGAALPSLYASQVALQVFDGYSTTRGLRNGAIEANSILGRMASHPVALWAAKGGAAFASIYVAERLWRGNRRGQAIAVMLASNAILVAVAARNTSVLRAQR